MIVIGDGGEEPKLSDLRCNNERRWYLGLRPAKKTLQRNEAQRLRGSPNQAKRFQLKCTEAKYLRRFATQS